MIQAKYASSGLEKPFSARGINSQSSVSFHGDNTNNVAIKDANQKSDVNSTEHAQQMYGFNCQMRSASQGDCQAKTQYGSNCFVSSENGLQQSTDNSDSLIHQVSKINEQKIKNNEVVEYKMKNKDVLSDCFSQNLKHQAEEQQSYVLNLSKKDSNWRLGAFSQSSCSNASGSQMGAENIKHISYQEMLQSKIESNVFYNNASSPVKTLKVSHEDMMKSPSAQQQRQMVSPKTPENLQSDKKFAQEVVDSILMKSKSINGSGGEKLAKKNCTVPFEVLPILSLKDTKFKSMKVENEADGKSSSIFSQTPFKNLAKKIAQPNFDQQLAEQMYENIIDDSDDEDVQLKLRNKSTSLLPTHSRGSSHINAMTLFAYQGDTTKGDAFASAFSNMQINKDEIQNTANFHRQVTQSSHYSQTQSQQSPQSQGSSNGSMTAKIFANINSNLDNELDEEMQKNEVERTASQSSMATMESGQCEAGQNKVESPMYKLSMEDQQILNNIEFYCFDQTGCRMLQQKIETGSNDIFNQYLVKFMLPIIGDVMINQFGNYLCQKLIEVADQNILQLIVNQILNNIVYISLDIHGTRAVQTLIDKLATNILQEHQSLLADQNISNAQRIAICTKSRNHQILTQIINALNLQVVDLTKNMHGNHVIQAFLMIFKASNSPEEQDLIGSELTSQYTQFIFDACIRNCVDIGMHKHGCCVMQRCLEKGTRAQKLELANFIIQYMDYLIEDQYGNYLVQNVLKLEDASKNEQIFMQIAKDFIRLSKMKFSSNVIEKCLDSKSSNQKEAHIEKIFKGTFPQDDQQIVAKFANNYQLQKSLKTRVDFIVQELIYNQFGNYVIQRALNVIKDDLLKKEILYTIKSLSPSLVQVKHGQKVLTKLSKQYPAIFGGQSAYQQQQYESRQNNYVGGHQKQFQHRNNQNYHHKNVPFQQNNYIQNQPIYEPVNQQKFNLNSASFKPNFDENQVQPFWPQQNLY